MCVQDNYLWYSKHKEFSNGFVCVASFGYNAFVNTTDVTDQFGNGAINRDQDRSIRKDEQVIPDLGSIEGHATLGKSL